MTTPTKTAKERATNILDIAAKQVWKQMGYDDYKPPEVTPDKLRQWMPPVIPSELNPFQGVEFANCEEIPKDEDDNWSWAYRAWYRLVRCQQQHVDDVPIQTDEVNTPTTIFPDGHEIDVPTTVVTNREEIKPRHIAGLGMTAILCGWNHEEELYYLKKHAGLSSLEEGIVVVHNLWKIVNEKHKGEFYHPIEAIVQAYLQETTVKHISKEFDRTHPVAILERNIMGSVRDMPHWTSRAEDIGELRISAPAPKVAQIPLFKMESVLPDVLPIEFIHMAEGAPHTRKSGHVAMPIRLFFEAVMALEPKETREDIHFKLGDLLQYLNPNGTYDRKKHLPYVLQGLRLLLYLRIPYRENPDKPSTEVDWIPVLPRTVPNEQSADDASIILEVRLPPDAAGGMMVEKETLRLMGKKSSARFNAYLTACWIFDKYGTRKGAIIDPTIPAEDRDKDGYLISSAGERIYNKRGTPLKNPYHKKALAKLDRVENRARKCYPLLSFDELTRACYPAGFDKRKQKTYQKRALKAWEALETDGFIRIEKLLHRWRIMPSESHVRRYRALKMD